MELKRPPPIKPVYEQSKLNDTIDFGKVAIKCKMGGVTHEGEGRSYLEFGPGCHLQFTCRLTTSFQEPPLRRYLRVTTRHKSN